jgi:hypothetical protein
MFNKLTLKLATVLMLGIVLIGPHTSAHASKSLDTATPINFDDDYGDREKNECLDWDLGVFTKNCDLSNY